MLKLTPIYYDKKGIGKFLLSIRVLLYVIAGPADWLIVFAE